MSKTFLIVALWVKSITWWLFSIILLLRIFYSNLKWEVTDHEGMHISYVNTHEINIIYVSVYMYMYILIFCFIKRELIKQMCD